VRETERVRRHVIREDCSAGRRRQVLGGPWRARRPWRVAKEVLVEALDEGIVVEDASRFGAVDEALAERVPRGWKGWCVVDERVGVCC
jgi:hypothetical protein